MKLRMIAILALVFTGCATTAKFEAKVRSWEEKDTNSLVRAWGQPDSIEKLSNGNEMYVYARLKHLPVAYGSPRTIASVTPQNGTKRTPSATATATASVPASATASVPASASTGGSVSNSGEVYIQCATYFEMSPQHKIVSTLYRGDECKSRD